MLAELQKQLETRFSELAALRRDLKYPVYAIEHGVDELTLRNAQAESTVCLRTSGPLPQHWLVWTALAAEVGYTFSGDEFWRPFEREPGQWAATERRRTLRSFYERFCVEYGGPKLVGRWAAHFNIISWPVANAILPLYLQRYFVKHLYDLRYELAHRVATDGPGVGQFLLDAYEHGTSPRFRDFLQQTDLTAQIVFALRDEHLENSVPRIDPDVLLRIVGDLERHRLDRSYLRDTRRALHSAGIKISTYLRPMLGGQGSGLGRSSQIPSRTSLVARRQGDGSFVLGFRLPDIKAILEAGGLDRNALGNAARVRFVDRQDRPEPASALIGQGLKERRLDTFPGPHAQLFSLEQVPNGVRVLLDPASRVEESRVWLLKRQADGLYQEVVHSQIRVGQDYLLLSRTRLADSAVQTAGLSSVISAPSQVFAYRLSTPSRIAPGQIAALNALGIGSRTGITIDAVGINPAASRGVGGIPAWTSAETVTLRLRADVNASTFQIAIDGGPPQSFTTGDGAALVELGELDPGRHEVAVSLVSSDGTPTTPDTFAFEILSPAPWPHSMRERSGFRLQVQPSGATLEQLISGEATLHVIGPAGRVVHWSLELYDASGQFIGAVRVGDTKAGDQAGSLCSMLEGAFRDHADKIDDAPRIDVVASLDELGRQAQSFAHPVNPLRWKFDVSKGIIHLIDETDHAQPLVVRAFPFGTPTLRKDLDSVAVQQGAVVEPPGVLFEAIAGDEQARVFASPKRAGVLHDLSALNEDQNLGLAASAPATLFKLVNGLRRWKQAVAVGQLALLRKQTALRWFEQQIEILACGADFSAALRSMATQRDWERVQRSVGGSPGFGYRMRTFAERTFKGAVPQLMDAAVRYSIDGAQEWAEAAARLAFNPMLLRVPADTDRGAYFEALLSKRTLLRGAFLARAASRVAVDDRIQESA